MTDPSLLPDSLITAKYVAATCSISASSVVRQVADGLLPPPIKLGKRCIRFVNNEVQQVRQARAKGADEAALRQLVARLVAARTMPGAA